MFLLILGQDKSCFYYYLPLHSTMFLLIPGADDNIGEVNDFTFHDVSINTAFAAAFAPILNALHSTMFLLILFVYGTAHTY